MAILGQNGVSLKEGGISTGDGIDSSGISTGGGIGSSIDIANYELIKEKVRSDVVKEIKSMFEELDRKQKDFDNAFEKLRQSISEIGEDTKKDLRKISSDANKNIFSVMGMFFTIFTFVSVSIQIFSRVDDAFSAAIILFALLSGMFSLVSFFLMIMNGGNGLKHITVCSLLFFIVTIIAYPICGKVFGIKLHPVGGSFQYTESMKSEIKNIIYDELWTRDFRQGVEDVVQDMAN